MVVPFDIVISRAAAEAMNREVGRFCNACGAERKFRDKYRYVEPPPEEALEIARWEIVRDDAALHLMKLVLDHVIDPYFK